MGFATQIGHGNATLVLKTYGRLLLDEADLKQARVVA